MLTYTRDAFGRTVVLADPYAGRTTCTYDQGGRLTGLTNPIAERTTFVYDTAGYEARRVPACGVTVSHTYGAAG